MKHDLLAIEHLIANFQKLGGVGYKTAQRYAYKIIEMSKDDVSDFASSLLDVKNNIHYCKICGNFTEGEICSICSERKSNIVCVVKEPKDILSLIHI